LLIFLAFQTNIIEITQVCCLGLKFDTFAGIHLGFLNYIIEKHIFIL